MHKLEKGFTLIELVVVIVILGILAATALPKFQDLQTEARQAVTDSAAAAFKSAAVITLAKNKGVVPDAATVITNTVVEGVKFGSDASDTGTPACPGDVTVYHVDDVAVKTPITMDVTVCNG